MNPRTWLAVSVLFWSGAALAENGAQVKLPDLSALSAKASESVNITLDASLLAMAGRFLDDKNPGDADAKRVISGLKGIYVRSFTFDQPFVYPQADIDALRKQLGAPGWNRLVEVRSRQDSANVEIYVFTVGDKPQGLVIISSEPREFTLVNIVGSIDLEKLHQLEGQFGVPRLGLEEKKPPTQ